MRYEGFRNVLASGVLFSVGALASAQTAPSYDPPNPPADAVKWVNKLVGEFPESDRMENVLLPALAAMTPPPAAIATPATAALLAPGGKSAAAWDAAVAWVQAEPQQKAIEALKKVTEENSRFVFSLPYGASASADIAKTGLTADLGVPPVLAAAEFKYLTAFSRLGSLVQVEATRLAESGEDKEAADLLLHWLRFSRGIADRQFFKEKLWAFQAMRRTLERLRDIAYTYPKAIEEPQLLEIINALDERAFAIDRIALPDGDRIAALQLIALTINAKSQPNVDTFGPILARLAAGDRPLRLFGQAAHWQKIAGTHGDWFTVIDALKAVANDWQFRWGLDPHDDILRSQMEYFKFDRAKASILAAALPDLGRLFTERLLLRTELAGTRMALGVDALAMRQRSFPKTLFLIRGRYAKEISIDPFDPKRDQPLQYFVPIRDQPQDERKGPQPHVTSVAPFEGDEIVATAPSVPSVLATLSAEDQRTVDQAAKGMLSAPISALRSEGVVQALQQLFSLGLTSDNVSEKWNSVPGFFRTTVGPVARLRSAEEWHAINLTALKRMVDSQVFRECAKKLKGSDDLQDGDALSLFQMFVRNWAEAQAGGVPQSEPSAAPAPASPGAPNSFTVPLDDTVFVLYSVGPDGKPNWAKSVGAGGSDILLWPPVMSLAREHAKK